MFYRIKTISHYFIPLFTFTIYHPWSVCLLAVLQVYLWTFPDLFVGDGLTASTYLYITYLFYVPVYVSKIRTLP